MSKFSFGIDLGTTNSCIAVMQGTTSENRRPAVITLADGRKTLPSCVWYKQDGTVVVGREAYNRRYLTDEVVYSSKREIGTDKVYKLHDGKLKVTPVQVAAEILKKLKQDTEVLYGKGAVDEIVITVPAYFDSNKRRATKQAAELAGIKVKAIINEPTSAALAYTLGTHTDDQFLVYDLGGGTFDVTLMSITHAGNTEFDMFADMDDTQDTLAQVIASAGDDHLGGDDLDRSLVELALDALNRDLNAKNKVHNFDVRSQISKEDLEKMVLFAESFKKNYREYQGVYEVPVTLGRSTKNYPVSFNARIMAEALEPLYQRTLVKIKECLAAKPGTSFKRLILVGGSTKLEMLQDRLKQDFPDVEIYCELNPDEAVALGAAVHMDISRGQTDMVVSDVLPRSIGVDYILAMENMNIPGRFKPVIAKDTVLPAEGKIVLMPTQDGQKEVTAAIYQGESNISDQNTYLGSIVIDNADLGEADKSGIEIKMRIDGDGILTVSMEAGSQTKEIQLQSVLNPEVAKNDAEKDPLNKAIDSFIQTISYSNMSEDEKDAFINQLEASRGDAKAFAAIRTKVRRRANENRTSIFTTSSTVTEEGAEGDED